MRDRASKSWAETHVFEPVLAELHHQMQEHQPGEPEAPHDHLFHRLHIQHTENEDELVENKIPKLVLEVLKRKMFARVSTSTANPFKRRLPNKSWVLWRTYLVLSSNTRPQENKREKLSPLKNRGKTPRKEPAGSGLSS